MPPAEFLDALDGARRQDKPLLLTNREREILIWVSRGKTNAEIATILWISPGTVRKHLENIYGKLGVSNRGGAVGALLGTSFE